MPSVSKSQQRLMGTALSVKKKKKKLKDINPNYRKKVKSMVDSMTTKQLTDFAETKHDKLPEKKASESRILNFSQFVIESQIN
jgi:hypothetical protein